MTGCTPDKDHLGLSILSFHMWVMLSLFLCILIGCVGLEQPKKTNPLPPHHTPKGFQNLYRPSERGFGDFLRWRFGLGPKEISPIPPEEVSNYKPESVQPATSLIKQPDSAQVQITWIGHSTFLIQIEGTNILTDPQFSDYCGPNSFLGINRVAPLGVPFDGLPPIHAVLISHNHYDHLDAPTVERLGNEPTYFVPLGIARWFEKRKIKNVVELDWWQTCPFHGLKVHSVPIQHFSNRTLFDRNETLWSGWMVETKSAKIFFAGDTGYSPIFKEIGHRFGPIQISIIPIGAYRPRWFMSPVHVDPPEAIKILKDTHSQIAIAGHWGTFKLSDEPLGEPPAYLRKALREDGIEEGQFITMKFGETLGLSNEGVVNRMND
jgi:N-acyl-phosphatidylethanolamine-hydrolysing phospholipase D